MAAPGNRPEESGIQFRLLTAAPRNRELTGAVDLLSYYGLREHYEKFCQKPLPASIGETPYLKNVVGDIDIRKGEGMELGQLLGPDNETLPVHIHQFDVDILQQAFSLRESGPISLPEADRGIPTISGNVKEEIKDKDRKHKKHKKHKDRHKDKDKEKDKDRHKDRDKEKKEKDRSKKKENGEDHSKKHHKKKRKHEGEEEDGEAHKHKKKKHKHSSKSEPHEVGDNQVHCVDISSTNVMGGTVDVMSALDVSLAMAEFPFCAFFQYGHSKNVETHSAAEAN